MKRLSAVAPAGRPVRIGTGRAGPVRVAFVLVGLVALAAACSSAVTTPQDWAPDRPVAAVTGFRSGSIFGLSGPVRVRITGPSASRLAQLVSQLPSAPQPDCHEGLNLIYRIVLGAGSGARSTTVVDGYQCVAAVTVSAAGKAIVWRRDATCELIDAVRQVLPDRARATHDLTVGCNSPPVSPGL